MLLLQDFDFLASSLLGQLEPIAEPKRIANIPKSDYKPLPLLVRYVILHV